MKKPDIQSSIEVERGDETLEVDVYGYAQKGEKQTRDHPGYASYVEFDHAELNGQNFELTTKEEEKAQKALDEVLEDGDGFDEPDPPSDREWDYDDD